MPAGLFKSRLLSICRVPLFRRSPTPQESAGAGLDSASAPRTMWSIFLKVPQEVNGLFNSDVRYPNSDGGGAAVGDGLTHRGHQQSLDAIAASASAAMAYF
jgi:hypothetical protein